MTPVSNIAAEETLRCQRVPPGERDQALAVLLSGTPNENKATVEPFLNFAQEHRLCLDELWQARHGKRLLASALLVPNPGRTAMLFVSPQRRAQGEAVAAELVRQACAAQDPEKVRIAQIVLDPGQRAEARVVEAAGFTRLAELLYMERAPDAAIAPLELSDGLEAVVWSEAQRDLFTRAILASYEGTQDCPSLVGLRQIEDVIAGHMAAGVFDPRLWFVVRQGNEPAAVMLLSRLPARRAFELVYLGVSRAWRGHGLARRLLRYGLSLASREAIDSMILAVDHRNAPALRLYRALRFTSTARKLAYIHVIGDRA